MLTQEELKITQKLVNKGLCAAAKQLGFFAKREVTVEKLCFSSLRLFETEQEKIEENYPLGTYLLITEIMGEFKGVCCLAFSPDEVDLLRKKALPEETFKNNQLYEQLKDAVLLEVDNIIAASMITEFANELDTQVYGQVPRLEVVQTEETYSFKSYVKKGGCAIGFRANFSSPQLNFAPSFVWCLDDSFIKKIKEN